MVLSHIVYNQYGILARVARKYNTNIVLSSRNALKSYTKLNIKASQFTPTEYDLEKVSSNINLIPEVDKYIAKRFAGNINQHDVLNAFKDKKEYTKDEILIKMNVNNNYPNAFVFPHAFSDAPHGSSYTLYKDYYEWYLETLKLISNIKDVNWFIKPHPSSHLYGEDGVAKEIFELYKQDNNKTHTNNHKHSYPTTNHKPNHN